MGAFFCGRVFKGLEVLGILLSLVCSCTMGYQHNGDRPLRKLCSSAFASHASSLLDEPIGLYEIQLLDALHSQPRIDEAGNRLENYRAIYENFQRKTNCLPWDSLVDGWHSHEEIKKLTHNCLCTSIRNAIVAHVMLAAPCEVSTAPHGQLSATYLALGHRSIALKRLVIGLHGNVTDLKRYDALVDECFTQFFQRVGAGIQLASGATTATPPRATATATVKRAGIGFPWFLVVLLPITAVACGLLFRHFQWQRQRQPMLRLLPPSVGPAVAVEQTIASTDGVAHPD